MIHTAYEMNTWKLAALCSLTMLVACGGDEEGDPYADDVAILVGDVRGAAKDSDGGGPVTGSESAALTAESSISFGQTAINTTSERELVIRNTGRSNLRIDSIVLNENSEGASDPREFLPVGEETTKYFKAIREGKKIFVAPGSAMTLSIQWAPKDVQQDSGSIVIKSNDPNRTEFNVAIRTPSLAPNIQAESVIRFPRVPAGGEVSLITFIQNAGQSTLQLKDIALSPQSTKDFSITFPQDPANPDDPDKQSNRWQPSIKPADQENPDQNRILMRVTFTPQEDVAREAKIVISSNDPDQPKYTINLEGNADSPCILLAGATKVPPAERLEEESHVVEFGQSQIARDNKKTVTIKNCSEGKDLEISKLELVKDSENFDSAVFDIPTVLEKDEEKGVIVIPQKETREFEVSYTPTDEVANLGRIIINSNDTANGTLRVNLRGKGTNNVCPVAVAEAGLVDMAGELTSVPSDSINTIPLKTIKLLSGNSRDPDGNNDALQYEWTVRSEPAGSVARLSPEGTAKEPSFFLDLAGEYVFELNVYDELGQRSCEPGIVKVLAIPDEDIHVQLVWKTPTDRDTSDSKGTDLDLHYLHPSANGVWNDKEWDVYWRQKTQDWGIKGDLTDDPSLDIDDTDGFGPENVNHDNPTSGKDYSVGVYYYDDDGFGASYATVRIYIEGEIKYETPSQYLQAEDTFWYVATVSWPSKQIIARGKVGPGSDFQGIAQ